MAKTKVKVMPLKQGKTKTTITKTAQEDRYEFLTDEQKMWAIGKWEQFLDEYRLVTTDCMAPEMVQQLNYGRVFIREHREALRRNRLEGPHSAELKSVPKEVWEEAANQATESDMKKFEFNLPKLSEVMQTPIETASDIQKRLDEAFSFEDEKELDDSDHIHPRQALEAKQVVIQYDERKAEILSKLSHHPQATLMEAAEKEQNPTKLKWIRAEELARNGNRSEWEQLGLEMQAMILYCLKWVKITNVVPIPFDVLDVYWERPTICDQAEETVKRRDFITAKVRDWWVRWVTKMKHEKAPLNLQSKSYRVILKAQILEKAIEDYACSWRMNGDPRQRTDESLQAEVGAAIQHYAYAHLPIDKSLIKPGPLQTVDPEYLEYRSLCIKFKIEVGKLLHEVIL